jgi:hypothetical protein
LVLLDILRTAGLHSDYWRFLAVPDIDLARIITLRFLDPDAEDRLRPLVAEARARRELQQDAGIHGLQANHHMSMAFIAALEGDTIETERRVRAWLREAARDLAELAVLRHHACRALGLAGAAPATVECLRSGLAEPSQVMPFLEPFLPYYDSMRDDPGYVAFLAEIEKI